MLICLANVYRLPYPQNWYTTAQSIGVVAGRNVKALVQKTDRDIPVFFTILLTRCLAVIKYSSKRFSTEKPKCILKSYINCTCYQNCSDCHIKNENLTFKYYIG